MIKKWIATCKRDESIVRLYVTTSDELVEYDLTVSESGSLIASGRQLNSRKNISDDANHHDLAVGAFSAYAHNRNISLARIELTVMIPEGLSGVAIGGSGNTFLLTVYEELVESGRNRD